MRKADNLPPSCVTKSGNLNFLELSGPVQACNGTALPLQSTSYTFNSSTKGLKNLTVPPCTKESILSSATVRSANLIYPRAVNVFVLLAGII